MKWWLSLGNLRTEDLEVMSTYILLSTRYFQQPTAEVALLLDVTLWKQCALAYERLQEEITW